MNILYLGSKSPARQRLLKNSDIPFVVLEQHADESGFDKGFSLQDAVTRIAVHKMQHVILPAGTENQTIFVLTADTLGADLQGNIYGKPTTIADALYMLVQLKEGVCGTAFCLERKRFVNGAWHTEKQHIEYVSAQYIFDVGRWAEQYCAHVDVLQISGAITIDGYGAQFLQMVNGSYTTIIGLPLFEVRQALEKLDFFPR